MDDVLFCSAAMWAEHEADVRRIAADIDVITFVDGERVSADDIARITIAFSSPDLYPNGVGAFMRVCLDAPGLRWLQVFSAGVDHPVFGMISDQGARLTTASGAASVPIAHHVVMSLLAMCHDLPGFIRDQHAHEWRPRPVLDLEGRTVAVLGMGPIGLEVARLVAAFGMRPIGLRRTVSGDEPCETLTFDRLDELLSIADDVVLALPLTPETRHLLGARELALLRPGAHLVNVGRGELIDEDALVETLRSGQIGGAALDVFTVEPLPEPSPLWDLPNVIITPHASGETPIAAQRVTAIFLDNLARWVADEPLRNEVPQGL